MNKKEYMEPAMRIVALRHRSPILTGSPDPVKIYRGSGDPKSGDDTLGDGDEII